MMSLVSSTTMAINMDMDLDFSGYSTITSTPTSDDDYVCNWNHWSPVVNWDTITGSQDDFHNLIDSMMDVDGVQLSPDYGASNSISTTEEEDDVEEPPPQPVAVVGDDFKGLRLVHLLIAAAEALTGANKSRDLARVILVRLKELVSQAHTHGTNMERLAAYFTDALQSLLEGVGGAHNNHHNKHYVTSGPHHRDEHHQNDMLAAFQLLQDVSPYVKFSHFTANQAILEAVAQERRVHIVDYDIMEGVQWASLIQAFASDKNSLSGPHLRITALSRTGTGRRSIATVQETGRRLTAFAASLNQPFSFHHCRLDSDEMFRPSTLKLVQGEGLVFNCMLNLPHLSYRSPNSVASFLDGAKALRPRLVTLVEEEAMSVVGGGVGFVGRFMESLHHYSAVFDSLEGGFPMKSRARTLVERVFLGPRIMGSLGRIYRMGGGEERGSWGEWLGAAGFKGVSISFANQSQARLLMGLFNHGYGVEQLNANKLVLDWKSKRMLSASLWTCSSQSDL